MDDKSASGSSAALAATVRRAVGRLGRRLRAEQAGTTLAAAAVGVLGSLQREGPSTPAALAAREFMLPQSLTRVLADLEQRGFVLRGDDPDDRRRAVMAITAAGLAALRAELAAREAWLAAALAALSPAERGVVRLAAELLLAVADAPPGGRPGAVSPAAAAARLARAWPDALRMFAAALGAYGLSAALGLPDGYWAVLTALIVTRPSAGGLMRAGADRLAATVAGAALATGLAAGRGWGVPEPALLAAALLPLSLLVAWDERFRAAPMAAIIVLSGGAALASPVAVALLRVAEVMLGAAVGIAVSAIVLPGLRDRRRRGEAAALARDLARLLGLALGERPADGTRLQAALRRRLRAFAVSALGEPSRRRREAAAGLVAPLTRLSGDVATLGRAWRVLDPALAAALRPAGDALTRAVAAAAAAFPDAAAAPWRQAFDHAVAAVGAACDTDGAAAGAAPAALPFLLDNLRADLGALAGAFAADGALPDVPAGAVAAATSAAPRRSSRP